VSRRALEAPSVAGVRITHPDRVIEPDGGLTKLELARYYARIARRMLPHLTGRPLALVRCPDGTSKPCFYQKHGGFTVPARVRRVRIREKTKAGEYLVVDDVGALVALVQVGVLEFHTWNARVASIDRPDRIVFDLDPGPGVPWESVVRAARVVRETLGRSKLRSFVKTTGGKGLHVVVPLVPADGWNACLAFARGVASEIEARDPSAFTTGFSKAKRRGRILLDVLRNVRGATSVAAFSTRARAGTPVSFPLAWNELEDASPSTFTAPRVLERVEEGWKDPWAGYARLRQRLPSPRPSSRGRFREETNARPPTSGGRSSPRA
jgi:bifunctional non-homologous end joining protein LigD